MNGLLRVSLATLIATTLGVAGFELSTLPPPPLTPAIEGIVWQPDNATVNIDGDWQRLGAHQLLVQWTVVDDQAFVPGTGLTEVPKLPDWQRIASRPWAQDVILGLAGYYSEQRSREQTAHLAELSERVAKLPTPLHVTGWYFPAEVDPSWTRASELPALLANLPRPLWISLYDGANIGPAATADWLQKWLPNDVGVFFQDGVGVYARTAPVARTYVQTLRKRLGPDRVKLIAEAFRPQVGGGFRPATAEELKSQLDTYRGLPVFLFDGPHYVTPEVVDTLSRK